MSNEKNVLNNVNDYQVIGNIKEKYQLMNEYDNKQKVKTINIVLVDIVQRS